MWTSLYRVAYAVFVALFNMFKGFPSTSCHYKELLYGAYKSDNPALYLKEILDNYKIKHGQILFLLKHLLNRDHLKNTLLMKDVVKEERKESEGSSPNARFIYYATSLCYIWHTGKQINAYRYLLSREESTIVCFSETNKAVPYLWLDICVLDGQVHLVRSNVPSFATFKLRSMWLWNDGGPREIIKKTTTFLMESGEQYESDLRDGAITITSIKIAVDEVGNVGIGSAFGMPVEWPHVLVLSFSNETAPYQLSKVLLNTEQGELTPILTSLMK